MPRNPVAKALRGQRFAVRVIPARRPDPPDPYEQLLDEIDAENAHCVWCGRPGKHEAQMVGGSYRCMTCGIKREGCCEGA